MIDIEEHIEEIKKQLPEIDSNCLDSLKSIQIKLDMAKEENRKPYLSKEDLVTVLNVYKKYVIPAAMRKEVEKLRRIKVFVENNNG